MKKILSFVIVSLFVIPCMYAGGIVTNTNQHAAYLRNPARDASFGIDAIYFNPAGIAFLGRGFHISLNNQSVIQSRNVEATFPLFQYQGNATQTFEGEVWAPIVPSLYAAYVADKWSISASFAVTGGGGKCDFGDGLPSFNSMVMAALYGQAGLTPNQYDINTSFVGKQYIFGLQLGATYKIMPELAVFAGVRANYNMQSYDGHLYANLKGSGTELYNMELDMEQTGLSFAPVLGIDYKTGKWNFGAKYEFRNKMTVKNDTKVNTSPLAAYNDGVESRADIPALLTLGASYEILPTLKAMVGFHYFFDKDAQLSGNKQTLLDENTTEYLIGMEFKPAPWLLLSYGWQITKYGECDDYLSDMAFTMDSYSQGLGAEISLSKKLKMNVGYFFTLYDNYTETSTNYNSTTLTGTDTYSRKNQVFSIGVDYSF